MQAHIQKQMEEISSPEFKERQLKEYQEDPNNMANWYPKLLGVAPTPDTTFVWIDQETVADFLNGGSASERVNQFLRELNLALDNMGYPAFIRSGIMSAKHDWEKSCYIPKALSLNDLANHVYTILEMNAMAWGTSLPTCFVVRELIKTAPVFHAFYGKMPITKERRYFINDGKVQCHHPYWPEEAFRDDDKLSDYKKLSLEIMNYEPDIEVRLLTEMSEFVATKFPGYWSLDWLQDVTGKWWAIDMAQGERSFHWKGCEHEKRD